VAVDRAVDARRRAALPRPAARAAELPETDGPHIGFLGRIVREKGLEHLVRAFRALPDPDARLLIGGDYSHVAGGSVISQVRTAMGDDDASGCWASCPRSGSATSTPRWTCSPCRR
jgi:hypothetical protein